MLSKHYGLGENVFDDFVLNVSRAITALIEKGYATPGRIIAAGISRGGYFAFRIMAADDRVCAFAGLAPVTDWRFLKEFESYKDTAELKQLRLHNFAKCAVGKYIYMMIGSHDDRVSTESCIRFYLNILDENKKAGMDNNRIDFYITTEEGHMVSKSWHIHCSEQLIKNLEGTRGQGTCPPVPVYNETIV